MGVNNVESSRCSVIVRVFSLRKLTNWHLCLAHISEEGVEQKCVKEAFDTKKVECRPLWKPMHKQPVYCEGSTETAPGVFEGPHMVAYTNGIEEGLFKVGFCLPAGPYVTDDDVRYIVTCIKETVGA